MHQIRRLCAMVSLSLFVLTAQAQPVRSELAQKELYLDKIQSLGRKLQMKCSEEIKDVMLGTTNGYKVVEQKQINSSSFVLNIPVSQKAFFLMIGLNNGKIYTEKIGVQ